MEEPVPALEPVLPRRPRRRRLVVVALAVLALVVLAVVGTLLLTRPSPAVGGAPRLVVVETGGGIATMDGLGEALHRQSVPGVQFQFPAWSPDGTRFAGIGRQGNSVSVMVFDADPASTRLPITIYESAERLAFYLYWSPDSRSVTFLTTAPNPGDIALRLAPADGSAAARTVREAAPFYWDFVDASRLLVHTGSTGPEAFTGEVDLGGTSLEASPIVPGLFRAPAVAADGSSRAYVSSAGEDPSGAGQVVLESRDGSTRHEVPVLGSAAFGFDPTSTTLAFIAPDEPRDPPSPFPVGPLRTVDAASGEIRTLLDADVLVFFWSPDGQTIAALDLRPADGVGPGQASRGPRTASAGALPPLATTAPGVGLHLTFVDSETGAVRSERDLRVSELFAFQVVPYFDQYALSHRFWASDSSAIVLPLAEENGLERVVVIPADGSDPRAVATGSIGFWSP
jgi:TolB protein